MMNSEELMSYSGKLKINGVNILFSLLNVYISGKKYNDVEWDEVEEQGFINQGAHGTVSLCKFKDHSMAVKSIQCDGANGLKVAVNDLRTISLNHPNIVKYYGLFVTEVRLSVNSILIHNIQDCIKICMEKMAGCFDTFLRKTNRPIPEEIIGKMSVSVVTALHFLKTNNVSSTRSYQYKFAKAVVFPSNFIWIFVQIMHRDVKPSNILMSWSGVVKLCDFGISRELVLSRAHTREVGCLLYLAPERFEENRPYDIRSDVWSFGITLVELATGKYPYTGNEYHIMKAIQDGDAPRLEAVRLVPI